MFERILKIIRNKIRNKQYVMTFMPKKGGTMILNASCIIHARMEEVKV